MNKGTTRRFGLAVAAVLVASLGIAAPASAGSASNPEIEDASNDVSPSAFAVQSQNPGLFDNLSAYDVVKAWIALESRDDFWIFIQVKDLADNLHLAARPPNNDIFGRNITFAGTQLIANFTIEGITYEAVARLAMPEPGGLMDNYTLWRDGWYLPIGGSYNLTQNWVALNVPKGPIGGPQFGESLTNFWVLGRFGNFSMDFAPNAVEADPMSTSPRVLVEQLSGGRLVTPQYGDSYAFGQYPAPIFADLRLSFVEGPQRSVPAGIPAVHELFVENRASQADTVYLSASSPPSGWSQQISEAEFSLGAGASRTIQFSVLSSQAGGVLESTVYISSDNGATRTVRFLTLVEEADGSLPTGGPSGGPGPGSSGPGGGSPPAPASKKSIPGLEAVGIAAGLLAAAFAAGRRR